MGNYDFDEYSLRLRESSKCDRTLAESREEIQAMFLVSDIKQTRVYQEAKQEGREEGEINLLLRLLSKRFGKLTDSYIQTISKLTIEQLEDLGEVLLDFGDINDLDEWLKSHT
jgi:predicted transposase YdaD